MPLFEYGCSSCGHEFELLMLKASAPARCPSCGSEDLEKRFSRPAVSSVETRGRAVRAIRAKNRTTRRDQADAEVRRIEAHSRDHDE